VQLVLVRGRPLLAGQDEEQPPDLLGHVHAHLLVSALVVGPSERPARTACGPFHPVVHGHRRQCTLPWPVAVSVPPASSLTRAPLSLPVRSPFSESEWPSWSRNCRQSSRPGS